MGEACTTGPGSADDARRALGVAINRALLTMDSLRSLRWMLRIDFYLPVIGQQLKVDYRLANELVDAPQKVLDGTQLAEPSMVRIGRDAAKDFFARCLAEVISRGYSEPDDEELGKWAREVSGALSGKQHEDLVLGSKLVSEVTKDDLLWATSLSHKRMDFLAWAVSVLETATCPETPFQSLS